MIMSVSTGDRFITKYTILITFVEGNNHRTFGVILQFVPLTKQVLVSKVVKGSLADQLCIELRDELISVNNLIDISGTDLCTKFESSVCELFQCTDPHELTLELKQSSPQHLISTHPTVRSISICETHMH